MRYLCGLFVIGGMLFLAGCGIQMPVTEGLVFSSSDPYGLRHDDILPFLHYNGAVPLVSSMPGFLKPGISMLILFSISEKI